MSGHHHSNSLSGFPPHTAGMSATTDHPSLASTTVSSSRPMLIGASRGGKSTSSSTVSGKDGAAMMAQSCPTFSWQPPPPPVARPRIPSMDPPSLELPPSPPVFSPLQQQEVMKKKEENTGTQLKKQIYSRSLSNYSSSAPIHHIGLDYLTQNYNPSFSSVQEDDSDDDEDANKNNAVKINPTGTSTTAAAHDSDDDEEEAHTSGGIGVQAGKGVAVKNVPVNNQRRVSQTQNADFSSSFSLSKSPTIFSILTNTADTTDSSSSSSSSSSGGNSAVMYGSSIPKRPSARAVSSHVAAPFMNPNMLNTAATAPSHPDEQQTTEDTDHDADHDQAHNDDLQFSIQLNDEEEQHGTNNNETDFLPPIY